MDFCSRFRIRLWICSKKFVVSFIPFLQLSTLNPPLLFPLCIFPNMYLLFEWRPFSCVAPSIYKLNFFIVIVKIQTLNLRIIQWNQYLDMVQLSPPPRKTTGFGKLTSLLSFIGLFTLLPAALKIIWPSIQDLHDLSFNIMVLLSCNVIILGTYNIVMFYIYTSKIPFFQKYRNSDKPWPWQVDSSQWRKTLKKTLLTVLLNILIFNPLLSTYQYFTGALRYKKSLDEWPSILTMLWQFFFFMVIQDTIFYWSHSLLHHPKFYKIHKKHHQYTIAVTIASTYAHPIQYILGNAVPAGLGYHILAKLTSVHYITIISWMTFRLLETCEGHSGYDWSWSQMSFFPWKLGADYHDFHHSHNVGNYGSMFGFWDTVMKTNKDYRHVKSRKQ